MFFIKRELSGILITNVKGLIKEIEFVIIAGTFNVMQVEWFKC